MTGLLGLSFLFIMKKFIILCLTLIFFLYSSLPSFAISRFDAYSYWASAQNQASFFGNDILNMFNYSKSTGLNPPSSIQSEFYKNGYYSNNIALFNQHSGGTATFDLTGYRDVFSWTYNGADGTSPLDIGFVTGNGGSVTLTDSGARLGPYNGTTKKYLTYNSDKQIAVYNFRMSTSGISDSSNFSRVAVVFDHEGVSYSVVMTLSSLFIGWTGSTHPFNTGFGENRGAPHFDTTQYQDFQIVVENTTATLFINGGRYTTVIGQHFDDLPESGMYFVSNKYEYTNIYSVSAKILDKPTTTVTVNLGRSVLIPAGDDMEFYVHMRSGSVTNVTTETTLDFDYSLISNMSVIFNQELASVPILYDNDWLYVKVPSSDVDRTFAYCVFTFQTPYVNTTTGDQLRWDMEMAFSDLVFGDPDDIGLNPDVDPEEDKFRDDVIDGIGDINDSLDSIQDVLLTPPDLDEFHSYMDSVNGIFDEFDRYVFDQYPNFPPIAGAPEPDFVNRLWLIVDEVLNIGIPLQSRNLGWLSFNSDDGVFRLGHFIVWYTTIFLTRAFIYAISEAAKAKNNPIQGDGDD